MKAIGIYPGNFQPPHRGHFEAFKKLKHITGHDTFVITTDRNPIPAAPLNFGDKEQILTRLGIPHTKKVKDLNNPKEVLDNFSPEHIAVIYALSKKEADSKLKNDYYREFTGNTSDLLPVNQTSYIFIIDDSKIGDKVVTTNNIREILGSPKYNEDDRKKLFRWIFGWFDLGLYELLKEKFGYAYRSEKNPDSIAPSPNTSPSLSTDIKEELRKEIYRMLSELMSPSSTPQGNTTSLDSATMDGPDDMTSGEIHSQKAKTMQDLTKQKRDLERKKRMDKDQLERDKSSAELLRRTTIPDNQKTIDTLNKQISSQSSL